MPCFKLLIPGTDVKSTDDFGRNPLQIAQSKLKVLHRLFEPSNEGSIPLKNQVYQVKSDFFRLPQTRTPHN